MVNKFINEAQVKTFVKIDDANKDRTHYGFIAQELARIHPDLVNLNIDETMEQTIDDDGFVSPEGFKFSISPNYIIALLTRKIQLQEQQIEKNRDDIDYLLSTINTTTPTVNISVPAPTAPTKKKLVRVKRVVI